MGPRRLRQRGDNGREIVDGAAHDVDEDPRASQVTGQPGQMSRPDCVEAGIGEANGVEHPAPKLGDPGPGRAGARFDADRLRHQPAQAVELHHARELLPVAGGAGGEKDRILEIDAGGANRERGRGGPRCRRPVRHWTVVLTR